MKESYTTNTRHSAIKLVKSRGLFGLQIQSAKGSETVYAPTTSNYRLQWLTADSLVLKKVVWRDALVGRQRSVLLWRSIKDLVVSVEVFVELQDSCDVATPVAVVWR